MQTRRWLLAAMIACLPVTSLPIPCEAQVKPLAAFPCLALLALLALEVRPSLRLARGFWRPAALDLGLLAAFALWALAGGVLIALIAPPMPFRGQNGLSAYSRGALTLCMGCGFYVAARLSMRERTDVDWARRGLYAGMAAAIGLALLQWCAKTAVPWLAPLAWLPTRLLVDSPYADGSLWFGRSIGLALEPSWFASQITVLLLPVALSRLVPSITWTGARRLGSVAWPDAAMVALAIAGLAVSGSRGGLVAAVAMLAVGSALSAPRTHRVRIFAAGVAAAAVLLLAAALTVPFVRNSLDRVGQALCGRIGMVEFLTATAVDERVACWHAAAAAGAAHPLAGVGLGQVGLHFPAVYPEWARGQPSAGANTAERAEVLPNAKCMPARIFAETGAVGSLIAIAFLLVILMPRRGRQEGIALMASTGALALVVDAMSVDSFALPTGWWLLAWIAAENELAGRGEGRA